MTKNAVKCYGNHQNPPVDPYALTECPPLVRPGQGKNGFGTLAGYQYAADAEYPTGRAMADHGGRDFFGNAVPITAVPSRGAHQPPE